MSDDENKDPPGEYIPEKVKVHDIYRFVSTKLSEALLELESLLILGQLLHNDASHFVDKDVAEDITGALERVDKSRLQHQHGLSPRDDNVFFIEQHPYFFSKNGQDDE